MRACRSARRDRGERRGKGEPELDRRSAPSHPLDATALADACKEINVRIGKDGTGFSVAIRWRKVVDLVGIDDLAGQPFAGRAVGKSPRKP